MPIYIPGGGGTPGGTDTEVQFNDSGAFGGADAVVYDKTNEFFGAGIDDTGSVTLAHPFQVGGGNTYLPPTSVAGAITYYTPGAAPASGTVTITYAQVLSDAVAVTATQNDAETGYGPSDGTISLTYWVNPFQVVDGKTLYGPNVGVGFTDNNDAAPSFGVDLAWSAVTGATGYLITVSGTGHAGYEHQVVGAVTSFADQNVGWLAGTAAPNATTLTYNASGQVHDYHIYDYQTVAGVKLFSTSFLTKSITDDNRSQQAPANVSIIEQAGGTYSSNGAFTHNYQIWTQYADGGFSSSALTQSIQVSNTTVTQPGSFSANQNGAEAGYTANGYSANYYIIAYKSTPAGYVFSPATALGFSDNGDTLPYGVDLAWSASPGASGYILFINGGEYSLTYNSINVGNVTSYVDQAGGWAVTYPFQLSLLQTPSSLLSSQNDAEIGYTADGTNTFTYNIAAYWDTPLGRHYSAPGGVPSNFADNGDLSTFGVDLTWVAAPADIQTGINPNGYELWVVGGIHPLNTAVDVGNVTSFADQNIWGTLSYQVNGSSAYNFFYEVKPTWTAVTAAVDYLVLKSGGDSGWSYNFYFLSGGAVTFNDTDDSIWTSYAGTNPPTPTENTTWYDVHLGWSAVGGGPTYRTLMQLNGSGFIYGYDTASLSLIDGNSSFNWSTAGADTTVANTLFHATVATHTVKTYGYDNADAVYSVAHADNSVTDNGSGDYYTILWTASNYPTGVDKLKLIIDTIHGELLTSPTLTFTDINQSYNSNTTVTPNAVTPKFFSDRIGNVTTSTLTTDKIGTDVGLVSLGSGATATGLNGIAIGAGAYQAASNSISIGVNSGTTGGGSIAIGPLANTTGSDSIAIGDTATALSSSIAIGGGASVNTAGPGTAIGQNANSHGQDSLAIGRNSNCSSQQGLALGYGCIATTGFASFAIGQGCQSIGGSSTALGYGSIASGSNSVSIGVSTNVSGTNAVGIGHTASSTSTETIAIGGNANANTNYGIAIGYASAAGGGTDVAIGFGSQSSNTNGLAVGTQDFATGVGSTAVGYTNHAAGDHASSLGHNNTATGLNSSAVGYTNSVGTGCASSHAFGNLNTIATSSTGSGAFGYNNTINATSPNCFALGSGNTIAGGSASYAIGQNNSLTGANQIVIGYAVSSPPAGSITLAPASGTGTARFLTNSTNFLFPTAAGTSGYPLVTDGAGTTSWAQLGLSAINAKLQSSLFTHFVDAGNTTTTETTLYTDTTAAGQLATNGDRIEAEYGGVFVSSATATREIKIYFAGSVIMDTGALTLTLSSAWTVYVTLIRVSSTVVRYMVSLTTQGAALAAYTAVGELTGLTLSGTNILKITGQAASTGAATNDIVAKMGSVNYLPA